MSYWPWHFGLAGRVFAPSRIAKPFFSPEREHESNQKRSNRCVWLTLALLLLKRMRARSQAVKRSTSRRPSDTRPTASSRRRSSNTARAQADPQAGEVYLALGEAYLKLGDGGSSARSLIRAADLLPTRVDVQLKAGNLLLLAGRFDDAEGSGRKGARSGAKRY